MTLGQMAVLENIVIVLCVAAISISGIIMFHSFGGLWSMLMLFSVNTEIPKDKP